MAEIKYTPSSSGYTSDLWFIDMFDAYYEYNSKNGWSTSSSTIIQGSVFPAYPDQDFKNCNYYGIMYFDFAAIRAKNATHRPVGIRLRLKSHTGASRMLYVHMGKGMAKDSYVSGTRPVNADNGEGGTLTYKNVTCAANAWCEISTTDANWLKALVDPDTTCFYINRNPTGTSPAGDGGYYWEGDGALTDNKPELYIDWISREPNPTPPSGVLTVSPLPLKTATATFDWGNASDTVFTSGQLYYEMQISYNGGTSWSATYTSAQGNSHYALDIKAALELADKQYYYNANCKFRVRTKTPLYNGQHYYSSWVSSVTFKIDYRIVPSAPVSLVPTKSDPYEGEIISFTIGRPASYNTHDSGGNVMSLIYWVRYGDGTNLWGATRSSTQDPAIFPTPELPDKTVGMADFTTTIRAYVIDMEGQTGPFGSSIPFTIKRFRTPSVIITNSAAMRSGPETATVNILVADTGYGGTQNSGQIHQIEYRTRQLPSGLWSSWDTATLGAWNGLTNSFSLSGFGADTQYLVSVRATNNAPGGTALSGKTSAEYTATLLGYIPAFAVLRNSATGVSGTYTKSLIVGPDPQKPVHAGELRLRALEDGWIDAHETWTYASATTITVPSGAMTRYQRGDKIKLKQGGDWKYFFVMTAANTALTITGGSDYTLTSATITDNYYSKAENPQGFPDWFNWTPTLAGAGSMTFTDVTVDWAVFSISGRKCTCSLRARGTLGGTPSIQVNATLPITPAETNWPGTGWVYDGLSVQALVFTSSSGGIAIGKYDGSNYGLGSPKHVCAYIEYRY